MPTRLRWALLAWALSIPTVRAQIWPFESEHRGSIAEDKAGIIWISIKGGLLDSMIVRDFEISKTEVTLQQYGECVKAGACREPESYSYSSTSRFHQDCNWGRFGRENHPINCVNWNQANTFALWAGGRLPTEAEWLYAARSQGQKQKYSWGDEQATCDYAVISEGGNGCGQNGTWPVCSKPKGNTNQGVCDMSGNVWEWMADCFENCSDTPGEGTEDINGPKRAIRGGGWVNGASGVDTALRGGFIPVSFFGSLGFRLVR
ncbi:formylglycine-generating enzyme family protein [Myxococcota bacterium]|nr:formylglycine-generating enzyme family protein [Myxococcota bacterium]